MGLQAPLSGVAVAAGAALCAAVAVSRKNNAAVRRKLTVMFIRHAESMGNLAQERGAADESPTDAPISPLGHEQCASAQPLVALQLDRAGSKGWLLASSPLTRAIETAEEVWPPQAVPPSRRGVAAELREYLIDCDDIGTPRSKLQALWPTLAPAMADLDEVWWSLPAGATSPPDSVYGGEDGWCRNTPDAHPEIVDQAHVIKRAAAGLEWICAQPESKVAVVAHGALLKQMIGRLGVHARFPNCGVLVLELEVGLESQCSASTRLLYSSFGGVAVFDRPL